MSDTFYITTPIYYPNGDPHLGSVYTTVICDVLARYHRLLGEPTYFLTGTDEHGLKMAKAAAAEGAEPQALADKYSAVFQNLWRELKISNDDFIRTTEVRHKHAVGKIVEKMLSKGDIYLGSYEGWYDEGQEQFITETEARSSDYKSPISGRPLSRYKEPTYFFRLTKYVPALIAYIEQHENFVIPHARRNEVLSKLREDVQDLSISRATLKWGIPMPHDPSHVLYVWIDALTNYITALGYGSDDDSLFKRFWPGTHIIGKDILWFHAVYWPAMLLSLDLPFPNQIAAHGWWTAEGKKMSKSLGNVIDVAKIRQLSAAHGLDAIRYYLLRAAPFGSDLDWSEQDFSKSFNELANVLGNLLNRTLNMLNKYRGGVLPAAKPSEQIDHDLKSKTEQLSTAIAEAYSKLNLQEVALLPIELARAANGYIDATRPFSLAKDPAQAERLNTVLNLSSQATKTALAALLPVLPEKCAAGLEQLGVDVNATSLTQLLQQELPSGHQAKAGTPLFPRQIN
ncbi:MAG TPA: methionine--tRNA ligase [Tepidisphaeraceae bacterium]|nr:methionine--tRNA ligase [Tepidisphaeraceae bacterium]